MRATLVEVSLNIEKWRERFDIMVGNEICLCYEKLRNDPKPIDCANSIY
jgi:hypothetical protein